MLVVNITIRGYEPIRLPTVAVPTVGKFGEDTSYVARLLGELRKPSYIGGRLPCKILSLEFLKSQMNVAGGVYYSEPMAGVGLTARVLGFGKQYLNDNSPDCLEALRTNFPKSTITNRDIRKLDFECGDLTFLDFNNFTFRRRIEFGSLLDYTFNYSSNYVILNDCTPFYFRYGSRSFETYSALLGSPISTIEDYFEAAALAWEEARQDWHMVAVGWFRDTSFQLFGRSKLPLKIQQFTRSDVSEAMIQVS